MSVRRSDPRKARVEFEPFFLEHELLGEAARRRVVAFIERRVRSLIKELQKPGQLDGVAVVEHSHLDLGCLMQRGPALLPGAPSATIARRYRSEQAWVHRYTRAAWAFKGTYPIKVRAPVAARNPSQEEKVLSEIEGLAGVVWYLMFRSFEMRTLEEALIFCAGYCYRMWAVPYGGEVKAGKPHEPPLRSLSNGMGLEWVEAWRKQEEKRVPVQTIAPVASTGVTE